MIRFIVSGDLKLAHLILKLELPYHGLASPILSTFLADLQHSFVDEMPDLVMFRKIRITPQIATAANCLRNALAPFR